MIVDDEPLSIRVVEKYLIDLPQLELVTTCTNALSAMEVLKTESVDLLFLDINMPRLSGISFLKTLREPPLVIFISAYPQYAVEGFELEALDYLLKPFSFERFLKAVRRAEDKLAIPVAASEKHYLLIKADKKLYKIDFQDIQYLQAYGDYVKVFTLNTTLVTKERLSKLESHLPESMFQKIHRSHTIALSAIEFIEGNQVQIGTTKLPIATTYKDDLMFRLKNR